MALKNYNPTSPARRGLILVDRSQLWKGKPVKALTEGKRKTGGRMLAIPHNSNLSNGLFFQTTVPVIFGELGDHVPADFIKDREALSGQPFNVAAMKSLAPFALTQIKAHAALLAQQLGAGGTFLAGAAGS